MTHIGMAFNKKILKDKLHNQANPLFSHIVSIIAFNMWSDWDKIITDILNKIGDLLDVKQHKKIMTHKFIIDGLLMEPLYDNGNEQELINNRVKKLSINKKIEIHKIPKWENIVKIYDDLVEYLIKHHMITRRDIRNIINKRI